jgi:hypothetical protein
MANELYQRIDQSKIMAKMITLEVKTAKFEVIQKSHMLNRYIYK